MGRFRAASVALVLGLAACGSPPVPQASSGQAAASEAAVSGPARLGAWLPLTGDLPMLGSSLQAAVRLAVDDVNDAGGLWGAPVELVVTDSAASVGDDGGRAEAAQELVEAGVFGAVVSSHWRGAREVLTAGDVVVLTPSGREVAFTEDELSGRVPPSEALTGVALAAAVTDAGATTVALVSRSDDYGTDIAEVVRRDLHAAGIEVVVDLAYGQTAQSFGGLVDEVADAAADAVVLIGFDETVQFADDLVERRGVDPRSVWTADLAGVEELPESLTGVRGVRWMVPDTSGFLARLDTGADELPNRWMPGAAYDAAVILMLAAAQAGTTDGRVVAGTLATVTTTGGQECSRVSECLELIDDQADITYVGVLGILDLDERHEPQRATYRVWQAQPDGSRATISESRVSLP